MTRVCVAGASGYAGSGAGPYVMGTLLAIREVTRKTGVTRGLDSRLFEA